MWVWLDKLVPANVGTPAGHEIAPCVKSPLAFVGTPAGHATVPVGVTVPVPLVPAAVTLCVWEASAAVEPEIVGALLDPAGVPAESLDVLADEPVKAGVELVPVGVRLSDPPPVPTLPCEASVPMIVTPSSAATSE